MTLKEGVAAVARRWPTSSRSTSCKKIGAIARPDDILFAADLPKTRSGKIMRRLLRDIAEGKALGDTTTLADPAVVARLKDAVPGRAVDSRERHRATRGYVGVR